MERIRVGIIGQGRSGRDIHAHSLQLLPELFDIRAVCDVLTERCQPTCQETGCEGYDNYHDLLKRTDLDLVVNATPSHLHVPVSLDILAAGHHLLCEKPLARRVADVDRLTEAAEQAGKYLAIYQQSRFAPYFQQVREVIDSGVLGRVVMIKVAFNGFARRWDWQCLQAMDGGSLLNTGPHPLDQALQLFDPEAMPDVLCRMDRANTFGDAEDHVKLILSGADRPTVDLEVSSCCAYSPYTYQVYGTRGGLTGTMEKLDWKYFASSPDAVDFMVGARF